MSSATEPTAETSLGRSPLRRLARRAVHSAETRRALALLIGTAVAAEIALAAASGVGAAAVGAAVLAAGGVIIARYVAGGHALDGGYRTDVRLVHQREPSLQGWAAAVEAARETAAGFDRALRPQLLRLYAVRLAERYGVSLQAEPHRAAELIGPELWPWLNPNRPAFTGQPQRRPLDRRAQAANLPPPIPDAVLEALVKRLETL